MKNPLVVIVEVDGEEITVRLRLKASGIYHCEWWFHGKHYAPSTKRCEIMPARVAAQTIVKKTVAQQLDPARDHVILGPAIEQYLEERWPHAPKSNRTLQDYRSRLGIFTRSAGEALNLSALSYDQAVGTVQKFMRERKALGDGLRNCIHFRTILKQFFGWLLTSRDELTGMPMVPWRFNPASTAEIKISNPEEKLLPALSEAELSLFSQAAKNSIPEKAGRNPVHGIWRMFLLCYGAGARPAEAARVKWSEVDFTSNTIILHGKKRARENKMSAWLRDELKALSGEQARDAKVVGVSRAGTSIQLQHFKKAWKLPDHFDYQALRRTAAKRMAPLMTVNQYQNFFGHSIEVAIKHYIGWGLLGSAEAANVLAMPVHAPSTTEKTTEATIKKQA